MNNVKIESLIQQLVADINTRALHKSQNGEAWTMEDCKRGADLGRATIKILKTYHEELYKELGV